MADRPAGSGYGGQGFSLRGEKGRFVLPPAFRNTIAETSGTRVLCLAKHDRWPCLTAFGTDRPATFEDQIDREEEKAIRLGQEFDRELRALQLWSFQEIPFDASGRFVMPDTMSELGRIEDSIYFQGIGAFFTLWNPALLETMGPGFEGAQAYSRKAVADAGAKGARK